MRFVSFYYKDRETIYVPIDRIDLIVLEQSGEVRVEIGECAYWLVGEQAARLLRLLEGDTYSVGQNIAAAQAGEGG